jgi:hypothetical protein
MFNVIPVTCMTTSAVSTESGMLTAATSVERRLNRNRKIVSTANRAPRPPSRSRPSRDSLMKVERSETVMTLSSGCFAPISASFAWTASATSTVLAFAFLLTVIVSDASPSVRA